MFDTIEPGRDDLLPLAESFETELSIEVYLCTRSKRGIECCRIVFICLRVRTGRNQFRTDPQQTHVATLFV